MVAVRDDTGKWVDNVGRMPGRVVSVNVGLPREIEWLGRRATTSIWKEAVEGRVKVAGVNLAGDDQADRRFHGGPDKAVYAYAREDYAWWSEELERPVEDATFGENLTSRASTSARPSSASGGRSARRFSRSRARARPAGSSARG